MREVSHFSRTLVSNEKMQYYPTDPIEVSKISKFFPFEEDEVTVLEPCIGKGEAVLELTRKTTNPHVKIFGVELDEKRYIEAKSNHLVDYCVQGDFFDLQCTNGSFSLCFCNPPYGVDAADGKRLETKFLRKLTTYMKKDGVLVWVIPYQLFERDPKHVRALTLRYDILHVLKFREDEYKKFRQIVIIARRKKVNKVEPIAEEELMAKVAVEDKIPLIPLEADIEEKDLIWLPKGYEGGVRTFAGSHFDEEAALEMLSESTLYNTLRARTSVQKYGLESMQPPLMPNRSQIFTLLSVGRTDISKMKSGFVQRGVVKTKTVEFVEDESITERTTSSTAVVIVEPTGKVLRMTADGGNYDDED